MDIFNSFKMIDTRELKGNPESMINLYLYPVKPTPLVGVPLIPEPGPYIFRTTVEERVKWLCEMSILNLFIVTKINFVTTSNLTKIKSILLFGWIINCHWDKVTTKTVKLRQPKFCIINWRLNKVSNFVFHFTVVVCFCLMIFRNVRRYCVSKWGFLLWPVI